MISPDPIVGPSWMLTTPIVSTFGSNSVTWLPNDGGEPASLALESAMLARKWF